jgi:hypothetical protein
MLIRISILLCVLTLVCPNGLIHAQNLSSEPEYVDIRWKVGTEKTVSVHDTTLIYADNELLSSAFVKYSYKLKILNQKDSVYEVRFKHLSLASDLILNSQIPELDEAAEKFITIINEVENSIKKFEFILLVDQNSGFAFEIKNEQKFLDLMTQTTNKIIFELAKYFGENLDSQKRKVIEFKIKEELETKSEAILKTTMNSLNYMLQIYSFPYILNGTHFFETELESVDQINENDLSSLAKIEVKANKSNNTLTHRAIYHYDKAEMFEKSKKESDDFPSISIEEFAIFEEITTIFDLKTSWILSSRSTSDVIMGEIQAKNIAVVVLN